MDSLVVIDSESMKDMTIEEGLEQMEYLATLNQLVQEGKITVQEDSNGEIRLYPV